MWAGAAAARAERAPARGVAAGGACPPCARRPWQRTWPPPLPLRPAAACAHASPPMPSTHWQLVAARRGAAPGYAGARGGPRGQVRGTQCVLSSPTLRRRSKSARQAGVSGTRMLCHAAATAAPRRRTDLWGRGRRAGHDMARRAARGVGLPIDCRGGGAHGRPRAARRRARAQLSQWGSPARAQTTGARRGVWWGPGLVHWGGAPAGARARPPARA